MEFSSIEWTDHTFNPWIGCQKVSPGCDHCYAETMNNRYKWNGAGWGPGAPRKRTSDANWRKPLGWAKQATKLGLSHRVFCASLADAFDNKAPEGARQDLFALIRATPELDWLLLTKRPKNIGKMLPADWGEGYANVWLGTTAEDQQRYDHRWRILSEVPAKVKFISYEPAIGRLKMGNVSESGAPDWIICGGETGHGARRMKKRWARNLRDECATLGVPFFMKQMTNKDTIPDDLFVREFPEPRRSLAA